MAVIRTLVTMLVIGVLTFVFATLLILSALVCPRARAAEVRR